MKIYAITLFVLLNAISTVALKESTNRRGKYRNLQATFEVSSLPKDNKGNNDPVIKPQTNVVTPKEEPKPPPPPPPPPIDLKTTKDKKCRHPKKALKEQPIRRQLVQLQEHNKNNHRIRVLQKRKEERIAEEKDTVGTSTFSVSTLSNIPPPPPPPPPPGPKEPYCLHDDFTSEECTNLQDGTLLLEHGNISGDLAIRIVHDDNINDNTIIENIENVFMYETREKYIGCDNIIDVRRKKHRLLIHDGNENHLPPPPPPNKDERSTYPKVTAIDFSNTELIEEGCGEEMDNIVVQGNACSLIKTSFNINYITTDDDNDDVTPQQEDEMYDLLVEIMKKQVTDGDFTNIGNVQSIQLQSLTSGTYSESIGNDTPPILENPGIPVGIALGAFAIIVAILAYYFCCRRRRSATVAKDNEENNNNDNSVSTDSDNNNVQQPPKEALVVEILDDDNSSHNEYFWKKKSKKKGQKENSTSAIPKTIEKRSL